MTFSEKSFDYELLRSNNFPNLKKPEICGYFSIGKEREFKPNFSNLLYFYGEIPLKKRVNFDLNSGSFDTYRRPEFLKDLEKINHMLEYLKQNTEKHLDFSKTRLFSFEFICFRGLITTILCTPYERREGWSICASYFRGNIYLLDLTRDEKRQQILNASDKQKQCCSWGYKFEQYLLTDNPAHLPDTSKPVIETEEFCCMFKTRINNISLMYGAEIDGVVSKRPVDSEVDLNNSELVELKTNRIIDNFRQQQNFIRYKLIKWWCQCFMVGVKDIVVGFRNDHGKVLELKQYSVKDLPKQADGIWYANVCMNFLSDFLNHVKQTILNDPTLSENDPLTVWRFDWDPPNLNVKCEKYEGFTNYSFLPQWFINHVDMFNKR